MQQQSGEKKYKIGYTTGVFDLFHIGHLNILRKSRAMCEHLIVGVTTDELVAYKNKRPVIPYEERFAIVEAIRYVDRTVPQDSMDKMEAWHRYHYDVIFVGDDWKNTEKWNRLEAELKPLGVDIVYFPYTKGTSSTMLHDALAKLRDEGRE